MAEHNNCNKIQCHYICSLRAVEFLLRIIIKFFEVLESGISPGKGIGSIFAGYVPLASPNPYPITVYSVANHRPHLSHF